ncbi:TPA: Na/Pi cotransporter family protein [Streptococcus pyogenes]|uniref:Na/Pi cotransporter family protein n=1 Tax=Streptococcus pyogenes TaxID=1314 RepID=UPI0002E8F41B|nr:Na/Pi cotransporter family protein [Streptococcus pyogenes]ESA59014.1 Na/Pi-cotransporter II-like protein [Streptococcus pyogenes GA40377]HER4569359.1 Na/Pi cotransporter family protein [Streptococcus pyogenes NGAS653]HER4723110.1 Na/Pi cotransporter family protein [Streptococcus pyogenes NGAS302]HER4729698.1 Na/Pi cotransporter family protein [Streptococcus pyogenes NGAS304]HER4781892.1 Na/Pi cotransporter family protein [Streptococcus pyogenes NGAS084]
MSVNWQDIAFHFFGGLGLFLFSIKYMGDGLQQAAGDKLRYYIDKYTSNPFFGILVGIAMSALIQSSSGVTVITVGLVSAGLLNLRQAIGIVMGANIGTTITSFLIGFKLGDYALPMIFIGAACLFFTSNKKLNNFGRIIFGVGGIFFSLNLMGDAMDPLKSVSAFQNYLATLGDKLFQGVFIGTALTMLIQSSAAIIGILQGLFSGGLLTLQGAIPILLGSNIGTCITAVLAAIGSNIAAKRVAAAHVLFNLIGTIIFMIILVPFTSLMLWLQSKLSLTPEMTIAFSHGSFNITNTILLIPFISLLAMIVTRLIPGEDEVVKYEALYLDRLLITQAPSIALGNAHKELVHLASYAIQAFEASYSYIMTADGKFGEKVKRYERAVDTIDEELTTYLVDISNEALSPSENEVLAGILDSSRDLERIGDHSESLGILIEGIISKQIGFSISARQELTEMYQLTHCLTLDAIRAIVDSDTDLAQTIVTRHKEIEEKERRLRKTHIKRLNCGECTAQAGINFIDIISHYTRITDHALNLAEKVLSHQL